MKIELPVRIVKEIDFNEDELRALLLDFLRWYEEEYGEPCDEEYSEEDFLDIIDKYIEEKKIE